MNNRAYNFLNILGKHKLLKTYTVHQDTCIAFVGWKCWPTLPACWFHPPQVQPMTALSHSWTGRSTMHKVERTPRVHQDVCSTPGPGVVRCDVPQKRWQNLLCNMHAFSHLSHHKIRNYTYASMKHINLSSLICRQAAAARTVMNPTVRIKLWFFE